MRFSSRGTLALAVLLLSLSASGLWGAETPFTWSTGEYRYDPAGNIVAIGPESFLYDTNSRLIQATVGGAAGFAVQDFAYDAYGNIVAKTLNGVPLAMAVEPSTNHLTGPYTQYDDAGDLVQWQGMASVVYQAGYDGLHMMQQLDDSTGNRVLHVYTADDQRLWTYDLGTSVSHWKVRDLGGKVLRDYRDDAGNWSVAKDYLYRDGELLAALAPSTGQQEHFSLDHLGTPRLVTDQAGSKIGFHTYLPFGEEWDPPRQEEGEAMKFTGHERDADPSSFGNDLDYMHARHYSPVMGRFLSVDPSLNSEAAQRNPQWWNRYAYVNDNPVIHRDPDGRNPLLGAFIGGLFGVGAESIRQVRSGQPVNNRRLIGALAGGLVSGSIAGVGQLPFMGLGAAGVYGGGGAVIGRGVESTITGDKVKSDVGFLAIAGAVGGPLAKIVGSLGPVAYQVIKEGGGPLLQHSLEMLADAGLKTNEMTLKEAEELHREVAALLQEMDRQLREIEEGERRDEERRHMEMQTHRRTGPR